MLFNQFDLKNEKNWKFIDYEDITESSSNSEIMKILQIELAKFRDYEDITESSSNPEILTILQIELVKFRDYEHIAETSSK